MKSLSKKFKPLGGLLEDVSFLVVDDESLMQVMIRQMLRDCGAVKLRFADSGIEAYHMLKAQRSQVVITDWHMPRMTGPELLQAIKNDPELFDIQVMILSGERSPLWVLHAFEEGVDGLVLKPFNQKAFVESLLKMMGKRRGSGRRKVDEVIRLKLLGNFQAAIDLGEQMLGEEDSAELSRTLAECHYRAGEYDKAQEKANAAMAEKQDSKTMGLVGKIHMEQGNHEEAIAVLKEAAEKNPFSFNPKMELAAALVKAERVEEARQIMDAQDMDKLTDMNLVDLARCYLLCTEVERAATVLNRSRDPLPQAASIFNACGAALWKMGRREESVKLYRRCLKISPVYPNAHYNLGLACCIMTSYEEAREVLESAVRLRPDFKAAKELLSYVKQKHLPSVE